LLIPDGTSFARLSSMTTLTTPQIPGYTFGEPTTAHSPLSLDDLRRLEQTATLSQEDEHYLEMAGDALEEQAEELVNAWRTVIGAQPHLADVFFGPNGKPVEDYKAAVKRRFVQWVTDTCRRPRDRTWLDYQEEIALRHTSARKNRTDNVQSAPFVPLRFVLAFAAVILTTVRPFLARKGHSEHDVQRMHDAWSKAVLLQMALWARPYVNNGEW
jgi:hypothetical protein